MKHPDDYPTNTAVRIETRRAEQIKLQAALEPAPITAPAATVAPAAPRATAPSSPPAPRVDGALALAAAREAVAAALRPGGLAVPGSDLALALAQIAARDPLHAACLVAPGVPVRVLLAETIAELRPGGTIEALRVLRKSDAELAAMFGIKAAG